MASYIIVNYNVDEPEGYKAYQQGAGAALRIGTDSNVRVLDSNTETLEGDTAGTQTVVLEFESREKALEIWNGDDYRAIVGQRHDATSKHFAILVDSL